VEFCSGFTGLHQGSWNSLHPDGLHQESTWSLPGVQQDSLIVYSGCYLREVQMDSRKTPDGVHQDLWLSVTTSFFACIHHPLLESGHNPVSSSWSLRLISRFVQSCSFL
jgi:hypothetical protein